MTMVLEDYYWHPAYTCIQVGEEYVSPGQLTTPISSQSVYMDDSVNLPTVVQTWR